MTRPWQWTVALLATSTPALACQCEDPAKMGDADRQREAEWIAKSGASIAEVELVRTAEGEQYRTVQHLFGPPQPAYPVIDPVGPITSCDYRITAGKREIMVFLPKGRGADAETSSPCGSTGHKGGGGFVPAGMCTQFFIQSSDNLSRVRRLAAR